MVGSGKKGVRQRKTAVIAGLSLIIMTLAAFFSYGFVHQSIVVQKDASATFHHILASKMLFKAELLGWFIILITDIAVTWCLYILLKPINKRLSLVGAWLRLIYAGVLLIAIHKLIFVLVLTNSTDYQSLFKIDQLQSTTMLYLGAFNSIWSFGLIIFGVHLLTVGYLAFKSDTIPKVISIMLLIASIGYIVIHLCTTLLPEYDRTIQVLQFIFTVPMITGELGLGLWLLFSGVSRDIA